MPGAAENHLPNCMGCRHHAITYEMTFRYSCQAMGFKSRQLPCRVVFNSSGLPCQFYAPRPARVNAAPP